MRPDDALILVVEDSDEDFAILARALRQLEFNRPIHRCKDGDECLAFLREPAAKPALILLDLNLPRTDGREVLEQIKSDPGLKTIPVTIMTTSATPADVKACYHGGANSYVTKRSDFGEYRNALGSLIDFWFATALLPHV